MLVPRKRAVHLLTSGQHGGEGLTSLARQGEARKKMGPNRKSRLTALLQAHEEETLRLRFAEVDNRMPLLFGVDRINLSVTSVPEPPALALLVIGILAIAALRCNERGGIDAVVAFPSGQRPVWIRVLPAALFRANQEGRFL